MHKTFFGTLHLCLTDEEKQYVIMARQATQPQANDVKSYLAQLAQLNQTIAGRAQLKDKK